MRGEYVIVQTFRPVQKGSPPLAWGILNFKIGIAVKVRITPTCVGNTRREACKELVARDHPHLRGEYKQGFDLMITREGSPPLAWGIQDRFGAASVVTRITPTCVGNTKLADLYKIPTEDHPHLRGEYLSSTVVPKHGKGSPPLAWGIRSVKIDGKTLHRITPTCVGNTSRSIVCHVVWEDHPHLRGEYTPKGRSSSGWAGSPPLAWGIHA